MTRTCTCCGKTVTWESLPLLGVKDYGPSGVMEFRNCTTCGSTLSRQIAAGQQLDQVSSETAHDVQFAATE